MFCAISGHVPEAPVASLKTGHVFEKGLIEKYIESTGKCPVTAEPLALTDLIPLKTAGAAKPRAPSATSIPAMLSLLHAEWDALMLESYELKDQLDKARKELAHSLYQHDASCRVIARLIAERDAARQALESSAAAATVAAGAASAAGATGEGVEPAAKRARGAAERAAGAEAPAEGAEGPTVSGSLPDSVAALFDATFQKLSKGRKKVGKSLPPTLAPPAAVATYGGAGGVSTSKVVGLGKAKVTAAELLPPDVAAACGAAAAAGGGDGGGAAEEAGAAAIVVGASDGTLRLTDARKGSVLRKFAGAGSGHSASICAVSCGAGVGGAPSVVSGDSNGVVKLWSLGGGGDDAAAQCAHTWAEHTAAATAVALHPTGGYALSASADGSFRLLDLERGGPSICSAAYAGAGSAVRCAALHPDGLIVATGIESGHIRIWDLKSLSNAATFDMGSGSGSGSGVQALAFSENGYHLASAGDDGLVKVWDLRKLSLLTTLGAAPASADGNGSGGGGAHGRVSSLRFDACAQYLAVGGSVGLSLYSAKSWDLLCAPEAAAIGGAVVAAGFAPDARAVVGATAKEVFACTAAQA